MSFMGFVTEVEGWVVKQNKSAILREALFQIWTDNYGEAPPEFFTDKELGKIHHLATEEAKAMYPQKVTQ